MLVLCRRVGEEIIIGSDIVLTIVDIRGDKVRLGITAPIEIPVHRREVAEAIALERLLKVESNREDDDLPAAQ
jgi:carbon storage regulator